MTQSSADGSCSTSCSPAPARTPLYIFTTSQTPLAARYPRPAKPNLIVPPLIHRSLHQALDQTPPSLASSTGHAGGVIVPHPDQLRKHDVPLPQGADHGDLEITLKVHLVGSAGAEERGQWVQDALVLLDKDLGLRGVDTLLVGFKGVDYKGKKTVEDTPTPAVNGHGNGDVTANRDAIGSGSASGSGSEEDKVPAEEYTVDKKVEDHIVEFWQRMTEGLRHGDKKVKRVGTMYLPLGVLRRLKALPAPGGGDAELELEINSLDTPDCHHLPKDYTGWARVNGVQLWAGGGGEGSDPLPSADLHNILQEFAAHLPHQSKQPLSKLIPLDETDQGRYDTSAQRGVDVKWVMGYTVVSSSRNVVEDKGYVVAADLLL